MKDLFGKETIRTIGLYQPYATLMLHGKIESRWVTNGKKAPFPTGKYLIYSTQKRYSLYEYKHLAGDYALKGSQLFKDDSTIDLNGYAIAVGELVKVAKIGVGELPKAFVDLNLEMIKMAPEGIDFFNEIIVDNHTLWGLHFTNVQRIDPFPFRGKQGVGFVTEEQKRLIKFSTVNST